MEPPQALFLKFSSANNLLPPPPHVLQHPRTPPLPSHVFTFVAASRHASLYTLRCTSLVWVWEPLHCVPPLHCYSSIAHELAPHLFPPCLCTAFFSLTLSVIPCIPFALEIMQHLQYLHPHYFCSSFSIPRAITPVRDDTSSILFAYLSFTCSV